MAYELIPGLRQNHRGQTYQLGRYPNGKLIAVPTAAPELTPSTAAAMEKVTVQSHSRLTLNADKQPGEPRNLEWVETALRKGSLFKQDDEFQSLACLQRRSV